MGHQSRLWQSFTRGSADEEFPAGSAGEEGSGVVTAVVQVWSLALNLPYASDKIKKKKKKKKDFVDELPPELAIYQRIYSVVDTVTNALTNVEQNAFHSPNNSVQEVLVYLHFLD